MPQHAPLDLQPALRNPNFASWKLDTQTTLHGTEHPLPSAVMPATTLLQAGGDHYTIVGGADGTTPQLCCMHLDDDALRIHIVAVMQMQYHHHLDNQMVQAQLDDASVNALHGMSLLLLSMGHGDLILLTRQLHGPCRIMDSPLHPLPCTPPLRTVRPLHLEAAWVSVMEPSTTLCLRVLAWTLHGQGADHHSPPCSVHVLTLRCRLDGADWDVRMVNETCVATSSLAPFAVAVDGGSGRLALAMCPVQDATPLAEGWGGDGVLDGAQGGEVDDVDPRTLEQAAQRLAQFTSQSLDNAVRRNEWADIYREDDEPHAYPACRVTQHAQHADGGWECLGEVACGPHHLLTACNAIAQHNQHALLALTDDVDAVVVRLTASADTPAACVQHVAQVPAWAYVAAGKPAARYLLIAPPETSIAAAIVESNRFAYVYARTPPGEATGRQLLTAMGDEDDSGVVGARVVTLGSGKAVLLVLKTSSLCTYSIE